ncbi:hypothetical protein GDO78_006637 [Eleutherodactylus coqui]|uniref:Uncharacterized protein n=1 Tax=Eleutherodactylus coqui TaxID=57060 RepID=A0A8J6FG54_ELECQ|nr:hypothetical protein GDO78_006637 [Eleutherodactylus coqui]
MCCTNKLSPVCRSPSPSPCARSADAHTATSLFCCEFHQNHIPTCMLIVIGKCRTFWAVISGGDVLCLSQRVAAMYLQCVRQDGPGGW